MRRFIARSGLLALFFAFLLALGIASLTRVRWGVGEADEFERQLLMAEIEEKGITLPFSLRETNEKELWLLVRYGNDAHVAAKRYGKAAIELYDRFGEYKEFQEVIHRYGYTQVIPIVWYLFQNERLSFEIRDKLGEFVAILKERRLPTGEEIQRVLEKELTPEERAWIAILRIQDEGNNFFRRFLIDEKDGVHPLVVARIFAVAEKILAGNLEALERKRKLKEQITGSDLAWAGVDTLVLLGFVGTETLALIKGGQAVVGMGKVASAAKVGTAAKMTKPASFVALGAQTKALAPTVVKYAGVGAGAYLIYKHPRVIHQGAGAIADLFGIPRGLIQFVVWTIIVMVIATPVLWFLNLLIWFLHQVFVMGQSVKSLWKVAPVGGMTPQVVTPQQEIPPSDGSTA